MLSRNLQSTVKLANRAAAAKMKTVTMIPGDGVGPDLMKSVEDVFKAAEVPVQFEKIHFSEISDRDSTVEMFDRVVDSINKNGIGIMGAVQAQEGNPAPKTSVFQLRTTLGMYANVCHVKSLEGLQSRYSNVDCVIIREQTEGEYKALEHEPISGIVEALKITTKPSTERICKFAFDFALRNGRKKVTCVHKANIMKQGDGMFMRTFHEVAKDYPMIQATDMIVDNTCMQMVSNPHQFDVMVMPNLYGSIVDNLAAGLVGGAGVVPAECYSTGQAIFEPGARHTFAGGMGKNIANPTAMLLCSANMLNHMSLNRHGNKIRNAVLKTVKKKKVKTLDMGGYATTSQYTKAVIENL